MFFRISLVLFSIPPMPSFIVEMALAVLPMLVATSFWFMWILVDNSPRYLWRLSTVSVLYAQSDFREVIVSQMVESSPYKGLRHHKLKKKILKLHFYFVNSDKIVKWRLSSSSSFNLWRPSSKSFDKLGIYIAILL